MTPTEQTYLRGVLDAIRERTAQRYEEACIRGDQSERFYWSGIVSAYDVTLSLLDEIERDGVPTPKLGPVTSICPDCKHPWALHNAIVGCEVVVQSPNNTAHDCVCRADNPFKPWSRVQ